MRILRGTLLIKFADKTKANPIFLGPLTLQKYGKEISVDWDEYTSRCGNKDAEVALKKITITTELTGDVLEILKGSEVKTAYCLNDSYCGPNHPITDIELCIYDADDKNSYVRWTKKSFVDAKFGVCYKLV